MGVKDFATSDQLGGEKIKGNTDLGHNMSAPINPGIEGRPSITRVNGEQDAKMSKPKPRD